MARESMLHTLLSGIADRLTRDSPNREAAYLSLMSMMYAQAAQLLGGEWVYVPRSNPLDLEQSRERITLALQAGEPPAQIARREGVTERHVRKVRGTIGP